MRLIDLAGRVNGQPSAYNSPVVVSADAQYFASSSGNGCAALNNTYGKGAYVNGTDYTQSLTLYAPTFPDATYMQWSWPDAASTTGGYAYGYPEILWGGSPDSAGPAGGPTTKQINAINTFSATYDVEIGGNVDSYNLLLDVYACATPSTYDGSHVKEISFYPYMDPGDTEDMSTIVQFTGYQAAVTIDGDEVMILPVDANGKSTAMLSATIDIKEILQYCISRGWLTGSEYIRGAEFGTEVQQPGNWGTTPHQGWMRVNQLSYVLE